MKRLFLFVAILIVAAQFAIAAEPQSHKFRRPPLPTGNTPESGSAEFPEREHERPEFEVPERIQQKAEELRDKFNKKLALDDISKMFTAEAKPNQPANRQAPAVHDRLQERPEVISGKIGQNRGISPFSPEADSYAGSVRSVFINLPLVTDPKIIKSKVGGTETMAKAELNKNFSGNLEYGTYKNVQIVGETNIDIRGPIDLNGEPTYLWIFTGRVQYFYYTKMNERIEKPFFFITHLETRYRERWETSCKLIGDKMIISSDSIKNAAAVVSEPLRRKNLKTKHDEAIAKEEWDFNNRTVEGKLVGYKHGKASIQKGKFAPTQLNVMKFSLDDQELIRAYIDHLGIPVRESSPDKGKK